MTTHRAAREIGAEMIAALMWGPKTGAQLMEHVGIHENTVWAWLKEFQRAGIVYKQKRLYHLQSKPFEVA